MEDIHVVCRDRVAAAWEEVNALYREAAPSLPRAGEKLSRPCPFCGATSTKPIRIQYEFALERCSTCRCVFLNGLYEPDIQQSIDNEFTRWSRVRQGYFCKHPEAGIIGDFETDVHYGVLYREVRLILSVLKEIAWNEPRGKTFLDVGCFKGYSVLAASRIGLDATGIEFDPKRIKFAQSVLGVEITQTLFENLLAEGRRYDLVTARHILEHVYDPESFLRKAQALLSAGGKLVILLPNFYGEPMRRMYAEGVIPGDLTIHHVNYFGVSHVIELVKRAGLSVDFFGSADVNTRISLRQRYGMGPGFRGVYHPAQDSGTLRYRVRELAKQTVFYPWCRAQTEKLLRTGVISSSVPPISEMYRDGERGGETCVLASK